jgi:hypothetical protein
VTQAMPEANRYATDRDGPKLNGPAEHPDGQRATRRPPGHSDLSGAKGNRACDPRETVKSSAVPTPGIP